MTASDLRVAPAILHITMGIKFSKMAIGAEK